MERRKDNRHNKKDISESELFRIPTVSNVIKLIENIHKAILHFGKNKAIQKINELKIYYNGINNDIIKIYNLCSVCIQKKVKFYKRLPTKQIVFDEPKQRYIIDLTYLPQELISGTHYQYVFNILDHFSKYLLSFLLKKNR